MTRKTIDFLIIGAGKSGTTSLFHYLSSHPQIYMPGDKDVAFFAREQLFAHGSEWYLEKWFGHAERKKLWGEASPAYMYYSRAPKRIRSMVPDVKLVAILRNPIERAYSHFRHAVRAGAESKSFGIRIRQLADRGNISDDEIAAASRQNGSFTEYIGAGQYGRILSKYLELFPRTQLRVIFFDDLLRNPMETTFQLCDWLGIPRTIPCRVFGKRYNVGGVVRFPRMARIHNRVARWAAERDVLKSTYYALPNDLRTRIRSVHNWLLTDFYVQQTSVAGPEASDRAFLANYYSLDVAKLEDLLQIKTPWPEFANSTKLAS